MNINISCKTCMWEGSPAELHVVEKSDHEVWQIFRCPLCGEKVAEQNKHGTRVRV